MANQSNHYTGGALEQGKMARASAVMGIAMLAGWVLPLVGLPLGLTGVIFGVLGFNSTRRDLARAGIFLNGLGLGLTFINLTISLYMLLTGKINPFIFFQ